MKLSRHPLMIAGNLPVPVDQGVVRKLEVSFEVLSAHREAFARAFLERLGRASPGVRGMFPADVGTTRAELMEGLGRAVALLREPEREREHLALLGRMLAARGARAEHAPLVCAVMVEAMAEACGGAWNADLSAEWGQALRLMAEIMGGAGLPSPGDQRTHDDHE